MHNQTMQPDGDLHKAVVQNRAYLLPEPQKHWGRRLAALMEETGVGPGKLAAGMGVTRNTPGNWKKAATPPRAFDYERAAKVLGVPVARLKADEDMERAFDEGVATAVGRMDAALDYLRAMLPDDLLDRPDPDWISAAEARPTSGQERAELRRLLRRLQALLDQEGGENPGSV